LLLYLCLLRPIIVICALDILLIKATYLLTNLQRKRTGHVNKVNILNF